MFEFEYECIFSKIQLNTDHIMTKSNLDFERFVIFNSMSYGKHIKFILRKRETNRYNMYALNVVETPLK